MRRMNVRAGTLLLVLVCVGVGAMECAFVPAAGMKQKKEASSDETPAVEQIEDFDPVSLDEDDAPSMQAHASGDRSRTHPDTSAVAGDEDKANDAEQVQGYRIQIFVSSNLESAQKIMAEAEEIFPQEVYLQYDAPYYKVRAGNCLTRREADLLKDKAILYGYRDTWIVQSLVASFRK